jgi:hypothetical protein
VNPQAGSAGSVAGIAETVLLPAGVRPPASISLEAAGDLWNRGGPGASGELDTVDTTTYSLNIAGIITVDPKGSVKLIGDQIAIVSGTIMAPGGNITLGGGTYTTPEGNPAYQESSPQASLAPAALLGEGVWLTSTGRLSVAGKQIAVPEMSGGAVFRDVLPGGQVTVSGGDIVLARGSVIDVSGAAGQSTLLAAGAFGPSNADPFLPQATAPVTSVGHHIDLGRAGRRARGNSFGWRRRRGRRGWHSKHHAGAARVGAVRQPNNIHTDRFPPR